MAVYQFTFEVDLEKDTEAELLKGELVLWLIEGDHGVPVIDIEKV